MNKQSGEGMVQGMVTKFCVVRRIPNVAPFHPIWAGRSASNTNRNDPAAGNIAVSQQEEKSKQKVGKR